jgi:hypothetical protein
MNGIEATVFKGLNEIIEVLFRDICEFGKLPSEEFFPGIGQLSPDGSGPFLDRFHSRHFEIFSLGLIGDHHTEGIGERPFFEVHIFDGERIFDLGQSIAIPSLEQLALGILDFRQPGLKAGCVGLGILNGLYEFSGGVHLAGGGEHDLIGSLHIADSIAEIKDDLLFLFMDDDFLTSDLQFGVIDCATSTAEANGQGEFHSEVPLGMISSQHISCGIGQFAHASQALFSDEIECGEQIISAGGCDERQFSSLESFAFDFGSSLNGFADGCIPVFVVHDNGRLRGFIGGADECVAGNWQADDVSKPAFGKIQAGNSAK